MQGCAPEAVDLTSESDETKQLYGLNDPVSGRLRQTVPAGPPLSRTRRALRSADQRRVCQIEDTWDAHANIVSNHPSTRMKWTSRSPA